MGTKMDVDTIKKKCEIFAREIWNMELKIPVRISGRMSKVLGCFYFNKRGHYPIEIVFAERLTNGNYNEHTVDDVILHELCHYVLFVQRKPHADHHPVFENELKRVGANSTNTIKTAGILHVGVCSKCGAKVIERPSIGRLNSYCKRYVSRCCRANIVNGGTIEREDQFIPRPPLDLSINGVREKASIANLGIITIQKPAAPKRQLEVKAVASSDFIQSGRRGVTNAQMIPAMKAALDAGSPERLRELRSFWPEVFQGSIRYLGKKYQQKLEQII